MHPDESALLAAVCAAPDDDLPRLVYADWLDEQGRHIRADFIRSHIELAQLEAWFRRFTTRDERKANGPEFGRRLSFLRKRVKELLDKHHDEAVGVPGSWKDYFITHRNLSLHRGFIDRFVGAGPATVNALPDMLSALAGPWPRVEVSGVEYHLANLWTEVRDPFADQTGWEWVTDLHSDGMYWHNYEHDRPLTPDELARLGNLPLTRLSTLSLKFWRFTDDHARVLAERFELPALRSLNLMQGNVTPAGVQALSEARWWAGLHELSLDCSPPVSDLVRVLTTARIPGLRSLTLGTNHQLSGRLGTQMAAELAAAYPAAAIHIT